MRALSQPIRVISRERCDTDDVPMEVSSSKLIQSYFSLNVSTEVHHGGLRREQLHCGLQIRPNVHMSGLHISSKALQTYHLCKFITKFWSSLN